MPQAIPLLLALVHLGFAAPSPQPEPLRLLVMDPLAAPLACACVAGYAQRDYGQLAGFLEERLARRVEVAFAESLGGAQTMAPKEIDLIVGKVSVVRHDSGTLGLPVRSLAMLSGKDGLITQTGLFVVRKDDPAKALPDLQGRQVLFGPKESQEKHDAARAALEAFDVRVPAEPKTASDCTAAAIAVIEKEADAAVLSSYAKPLMEGCGAIEKGEVRVIGQTDPVPFIGVFATERVDLETEAALDSALAEVAGDAKLLAALESRQGFVSLPPVTTPADPPGAAWPDWRGPTRDGASPAVPDKLPKAKRLLWSHVCTGPGMSGLAVQSGCVVVADKSLDQQNDLFRCLDADTGAELWKLEYAAPGEMDFTNSPRANPVIREGLVYVLGAYGHLHCLKQDTGQVVWRRNLAKDFAADVPQWGHASTPLFVDDKLIVSPGGKDAALVALDPKTGAVLWKSPGELPGYGSFIAGEFGGVRQIVGYDILSLGGWDPETGERLWELRPENEGDFNVPTPIAVGGQLLVSTENNGTRLYAFDAQGRILPKPVAANEDLRPDTSTPIVHRGLVFGNDTGLACLDFDAGLKDLWRTDEEPFEGHCSFVAGGGRVLVATQSGKLCLVRADKTGPQILGALDLFADVADTEREVWSHPALVGNRLYIRNLLGVYCFVL